MPDAQLSGPSTFDERTREHSESAINLKELESVIAAAKAVAKHYRNLTGRPLGITGEIAEYEAARLLGLRLADVRQDGYDAIRETGGVMRKLQVKGRCILDDSKPGQRIGAIRLEKNWDGVLLVLMDGDFEPLEIYEANRDAIEVALTEPGSIARNERGALSVSKFKSIGRRVWPDVFQPIGVEQLSDRHRSTIGGGTRRPGRGNTQRSEAMVLVGYFLARCWSGQRRTGPPVVLGTSRWEDVYPLFYDRLGGGRDLRSFRNSLQNTRDAFDAHVDNGRRGWWQKSLGELEQAVFDEWQSRPCTELWTHVRRYVTPLMAS